MNNSSFAIHHSPFIIRHSSFVILFLLCAPAFADLSVTVRPGYVFGTSERPTTSTLNRLGNPTILITGTVGGTNAAVAVGSINGAHFSDTVVDGTNITFNTANPRALKIVDSGVNVTQISTNIAGLGLTGGGGTNLNLNLEATNGLAITGDQLTVTNLPVSRLNLTSNYFILGTTNNVGLAVAFNTVAAMLFTNSIFTPFTGTFTSYEYPITTGAIVDTNHNLAATPGVVRCVLVCKTAENTFVAGDEIDVNGAIYRYGSGELILDPPFSVGANSTNVWVGALTTTPEIGNRTGNRVVLTPANWRIKVYCRP